MRVLLVFSTAGVIWPKRSVSDSGTSFTWPPHAPSAVQYWRLLDAGTVRLRRDLVVVKAVDYQYARRNALWPVALPPRILFPHSTTYLQL
jgi:hypothetical protein